MNEGNGIPEAVHMKWQCLGSAKKGSKLGKIFFLIKVEIEPFNVLQIKNKSEAEQTGMIITLERQVLAYGSESNGSLCGD